jgi:hypothetical protein
MKKLLLLNVGIVSLISLFYCQNSATPVKKNSATPLVKTGWEDDGLKGKVKSFTESQYGAEDRFGEIQKTNLSFKYIMRYDAKGNGIEAFCYNADGSFNSKETYQYAKGNRIETNYYSANGSFDGKYINKYDDKDNRIEANNYSANGSLDHKYIMKYDAKGNQIEANYYKADGSLDLKYIMKYDAKGNQIEENYYKADGSLDYKETYQYKFDGKGNWIKRITFKNQIPKSIYEREYEYYE